MRQRVLEGLLEAQELDDPDIHGRMEPDAALVGTQRRVELHPEAAVDLHLARIVGPGDAEDDLALRLADALDDLVLGVLGILAEHGAQRLGDLGDSLVELGLASVAPQHLVENRYELFVDQRQNFLASQVGRATWRERLCV